MFRIERLLLLLVFPVLSLAAASHDPVDLFGRHRYPEAASLWERTLQSFPPKAPLSEEGVRSLKGLSMAYYEQGRLYATLQVFSRALSSEYYRGVLAEEKSPLSLYYLGQVQYQRSAWDSAVGSFEKALKSGLSKTSAHVSPSVSAPVAEVDGVFLAFAKARRAHAPPPVPARLKLKSTTARWEAFDLAGAGPADLPAGLKALSARDRRCRLSIFARSSSPRIAETEMALAAVLADAKAPELSIDRGQNTQMDYYDPFLLETLSQAYLALSEWQQIRLLGEEKRFPDLAQKFSTRRNLSEASLLRGRYAEALQFLGADKDVPSRIVRAKILGKQGQLTQAGELLDSVTQGAKAPGILREVAESYYFLNIDLQKGLQLAQQALRDKDGENYYHISAALLLATGQNDAALEEYAKGYPIEFRDRLDQIDPEYMSDYSFAIFLNRKMRYEEVVETLYHLQKEIPACRQMHDAMQGISAAQVRGYESQRIFRKGD